MTHDLGELLEQTASTVPVGTPPIESMVAAAHRRRRRVASYTVMAVAAASAVVIGVATTLLPHATTSPDTVPSPVTTIPIPPDSRLVGVGHLSIAVPKSWGTNQTECGTAIKNTVILPGGPRDGCLFVPDHVSNSVTLSFGGDAPVPVGGERGTIDGVSVISTGVNCVDRQPAFTGRLCRAEVFVPDEHVLVDIESAHESVVTGLLATIAISPDQVAVPNYQGANARAQEHARRLYLALLHRLGLKARVRAALSSVWPPGFVLSVAPAVGQVLSPGDTVRVTVAALPIK